jgi:hypothetical protein
MAFESIVLGKIDEAVEAESLNVTHSNFSYGTLFFDADEKSALRLKKILANDADLICAIQLNRIGDTNEYAIDFI